MGVTTKIIGNGDVLNLKEAREKVETYGVDGVMIGRGIFHDPWLFNQTESIETKNVDEKIKALQYHLNLFESVWGKQKSFQVMKRFFKVYLSGFEGAVELRTSLMESQSYEEAHKHLNEFLKAA